MEGIQSKTSFVIQKSDGRTRVIHRENREKGENQEKSGYPL
mgnify:FL=1